MCEAALARVASKINLGDYLLLGRGQEMTGGRTRPSVLADALEALIAAVYLNTDIEQTFLFTERLFGEEISAAAASEDYGDFKTILQERIQKTFTENVRYEMLEEHGPDHNKSFIVGVTVSGKLLAKGKGKSKKEAEQNAAKKALEEMD